MPASLSACGRRACFGCCEPQLGQLDPRECRGLPVGVLDAKRPGRAAEDHAGYAAAQVAGVTVPREAREQLLTVAVEAGVARRRGAARGPYPSEHRCQIVEPVAGRHAVEIDDPGDRSGVVDLLDRLAAVALGGAPAPTTAIKVRRPARMLRAILP